MIMADDEDDDDDNDGMIMVVEMMTLMMMMMITIIMVIKHNHHESFILNRMQVFRTQTTSDSIFLVYRLLFIRFTLPETKTLRLFAESLIYSNNRKRMLKTSTPLICLMLCLVMILMVKSCQHCLAWKISSQHILLYYCYLVPFKFSAFHALVVHLWNLGFNS